MYLKRDIDNKILEASKQFACITLYGAPGIGKVTLIKHLFPNIKSVSLDDLEIRSYAKRDPKGFLKYYGTPLFIDEIQKVPELLDYIKIEIDNLKQEVVKGNSSLKLLYLLSGSNQYAIQKAVSESLAGRTCIFNLLSFSFNELSKRNESNAFNPSVDVLREKEKLLNNKYRSRKEIFEDIFKGGMPEYNLSNIDRDFFFKSYISTYIEKDVRLAISEDKELIFLDFMKYVALRTACQVDYSEVSRSLGIDSRTCKGWFSILETSGIIKLIEPYAKNKSDRIVKTSKMYFMDTGLCSYLAGIPTSEILEKSAFAGAFYETYVVSEIIKSYLNNYKNTDSIYYFRDKDQHEVDLIIDNFDSITPIEIKKGINPVSSSKNFKILEKYGIKINTGLVIDSSDKVFPINDSVYYCPIDLIGL